MSTDRSPSTAQATSNRAVEGAVARASAIAHEPVGVLLRKWRQHRGKSQLDLALEADVSTRHISFLENGRANPSREMIVHLCDALEVPLRERNRILEAGGFARIYRETPIDDPEMEHVGHVIDLLLESAQPSGALAVDWSWNVLKANRTMMVTMAYFIDPAVLGEAPLNVMGLLFAENGLHRHIVNWDEVGPATVARIRREAEYEGRPESADLLERLLTSSSAARAFGDVGHDGPAPLLLPMHLRKGEVELELFSTITTVGTPQDVTLQELRIESFHPMNARSEATLRALCEAAGTGETD